jgi:NADH:ubiquinone oxidoreductase subunit 4 (subunit M)
MIAVVIWMGVYPNSFLKPIQPSIANLIERVQVSQRAAATTLAQR